MIQASRDKRPPREGSAPSARPPRRRGNSRRAKSPGGSPRWAGGLSNSDKALAIGSRGSARGLSTLQCLLDHGGEELTSASTCWDRIEGVMESFSVSSSLMPTRAVSEGSRADLRAGR